MANVLLANAAHLTEFTTDPQSGVWLNGTCGETALAVALGCALGRPATLADMLHIYHDMRSRTLASLNGASTLDGLTQEAQSQGATILTAWDYAEPFSHDWHAYLLAHAGQEAIVLEFANAQALVDVQTGAADEQGVHYHYACCVGIQSEGYVFADGDNWQVAQRFQVYSAGTLQAAVPCGLLALEVPQMAQPTTIPAGWQDDGTTITAPNGITITAGFADYLRMHPAFWATCGNPMSAPSTVDPVGMDPKHGAGSEVIFQFAGLGYTVDEGVYPLWVGAMVAALRTQLMQAQQAIATITTQYDTTEAALVATQATLDALKQQVASSPSSLSPTDAAILAAAKSFMAAVQPVAVPAKG